MDDDDIQFTQSFHGQGYMKDYMSKVVVTQTVIPPITEPQTITVIDIGKLSSREQMKFMDDYEAYKRIKEVLE